MSICKRLCKRIYKLWRRHDTTFSAREAWQSIRPYLPILYGMGALEDVKSKLELPRQEWMYGLAGEITFTTYVEKKLPVLIAIKDLSLFTE